MARLYQDVKLCQNSKIFKAPLKLSIVQHLQDINHIRYKFSLMQDARTKDNKHTSIKLRQTWIKTGLGPLLRLDQAVSD